MLKWYTRFVHGLRKQPPEVKSQVALVGALSLTTIIAMVWATTLPARFKDVSQTTEQVQELADTVSSQATLLTNDFVPPEPSSPSKPLPQSAEENIRAKVDELLHSTNRSSTEVSPTVKDTPQETSPEQPEESSTSTENTYVSKPGMPVMIEAR